MQKETTTKQKQTTTTTTEEQKQTKNKQPKSTINTKLTDGKIEKKEKARWSHDFQTALPHS